MSSALRDARSPNLPVASDNGVLSRWLIFLVLLLISFHAAFRGIRSDYDAEGYSIWLERIGNLSVADFSAALLESSLYFESNLLFSFEIGFALLTFLVTRLSVDLGFFLFICAAGSLLLKAYAINKYCERPLLPLLWYLSWSYLLLEMTTIRAGIAGGILLIAYGPLVAKRHIHFAALVALATTFHASSAIALVLPILQRFSGSRRIPLVALAVSFGFSFLSILPIIEFAGNFSEKLTEYYALYDSIGLYEEINKFNVVVLTRISILCLAISWLNRNEANSQTNFHINLFVFSIFLYYGFASFPLVGARLYELFGIFQIFMISDISKLRVKILKSIVVAAIFLQFFILVFHVRFVDFFYFIGRSYDIETTHKR